MMQIKQATKEDFAVWLLLRNALWPNSQDESHLIQMSEILYQDDKTACFIAWDNEQAVGFAEASIKYDYVNGCNYRPAAFLEGIFVTANKRKQGVARKLCAMIEAWGKSKGCIELASDVEINNTASQQMHQALAFEETERVVFYRKKLV